jgi:hypothetical protein
MAAGAVWVGGARMQATDMRAVGQVVRAQATVLRCAVARGDGGGGLWWPEPMVEGSVHACVGPMSSSRAGYGAPSLDRW